MEGQTINLTVATSASGAVFVPLAVFRTYACTCVRIHNNTGFVLDVKRDDQTVAVPLQDKDKLTFWVSDPSRLSIRRTDTIGTPVNAVAEVISF